MKNHVPRLLQCGHTFCTNCLSEMQTNQQALSAPISVPQLDLGSSLIGVCCPLDGKVTLLPSPALEEKLKEEKKNDIEMKSDNALISPRIEQLPINRVVMDLLKLDSFLPISSTSSSNICQEHGDRIFEYCVQCKMPVCSLCVKYRSDEGRVKHDGHTSVLVKTVAATTRDSLATIQQSSKVSFI